MTSEHPRRRERGLLLAGLLVAGLLLVGGCAAVADDSARLAAPPVAGFWLGLWQGLIVPITFIVSLFNDGVAIYEVHNDGAWYDFGYVLGVALIFSGPARIGGPRRAST
ncbi:hypothetical protein [Actinomycetospora cinnamomea]|uniref:Lipoprotein n=1 Tax=Actinomycetospora cinnamomea TaxID=663609 RepID=A0A2U1F275_9PSEU|nr:hypothetical protein [Actinomycetospora cinnamomea]PVZ06285.1 hypothetical protein C8D89_11323 [Actinomycetospora cinnamomea]